MIDRDLFRINLVKYTKRAFQSLPELDKPDILDIGCGSGIPSLSLARLTNGQIVGIDNDPIALEQFNKKIQEQNLSHRIKTLQCDMKKMPFDDNSFDIVWAEGSIAFVGFEKGLEDWKKLIKPSGYLVIHDSLENIDEKKDQIKSAGYRLINHFILDESVWWDEYFGHLNKELKTGNTDGSLPLEGVALEVFKEIEMYHQSPEKIRSVYFILQKM